MRSAIKLKTFQGGNIPADHLWGNRMNEDFSPSPKAATKPWEIESELNDLLKFIEVAFNWKEARTEEREMIAFALNRRRFISKTLT